MMASHSKAEAEEVFEGEPNPDRMAKHVHNLFKFMNFYNQMDFNAEQRLAITMGIVELIDPSRDSGLVEQKP